MGGIGIGCARFPRLGDLKDAVPVARQGKDLPERVPEPRPFQLVGDRRLPLSNLGPELPAPLVALVHRQDHPVEVAGHERQRPVHQVAEVADKLAVHLLLEVIPGEGVVARLGAVVEDVKAPDVRRDSRVAGVVSEHADSLALRELPALVVQVLRTRHVVQERPVVATPEKARREDHGVKGDVVLPDELEQLHLLRVLPPVLRPAVSESGGHRDVADRRVEPDVKHLVLKPLQGHRNPPFEVPGNRPLPQPVTDPPLGHLDRVAGPLALDAGSGHPLLQLRQNRRQIDVEVGGFPDHRSRSVHGTAGIDEVRGIEQLAAVLALITAGILVAAVRARSADVAVGEEHLRLLAVELFDRFLTDVPVVVQFQEDVLGHLRVLRR